MRICYRMYVDTYYDCKPTIEYITIKIKNCKRYTKTNRLSNRKGKDE